MGSYNVISTRNQAFQLRVLKDEAQTWYFKNLQKAPQAEEKTCQPPLVALRNSLVMMLELELEGRAVGFSLGHLAWVGFLRWGLQVESL